MRIQLKWIVLLLSFLVCFSTCANNIFGADNNPNDPKSANYAGANKAITAFSFTSPSVTGIISGTEIAVTVPYGTNVTALVAIFTITGQKIVVGSNAQVSGTTSNNFSNPVVYTVTAKDNSTENYTVTLTIAPSTIPKAITAFSFANLSVTGTITGSAISVIVPYATNVTALVATFTTTGTSVEVGTTVQMSGITVNDFTNAVIYSVTAADGSTGSYTITIVYSPIPPTVTTSTITNIAQTSASGGGNVTSNGGGTITAYGVCWDTNPSPTVANAHTTDGTGAGIFTSILTILQSGSIYYVRAYATNSAGTAYGSQISFTTTTYIVGNTGPAGGLVFYDKGSYSNGWRYLEAAPTDQSTGIDWDYNGNVTLNGNTQIAIGSGITNTAAIIAQQGNSSFSNYAATLCANLSLGGFSNWFLPSKDELNQMWTNLASAGLGGFATDDYWSSSESTSTTAWSQAMNRFTGGYLVANLKYAAYSVRAVHQF